MLVYVAVSFKNTSCCACFFKMYKCTFSWCRGFLEPVGIVFLFTIHSAYQTITQFQYCKPILSLRFIFEMSKYDFKVIVVGGGPTGLALANMLEQLDIDYILLEAHAEITPRIGTGIFLSNSLRVLDQLGCLDAFYAGADEVEDLSVTVNGVTMFSPATAEHFRHRSVSCTMIPKFLF